MPKDIFHPVDRERISSAFPHRPGRQERGSPRAYLVKHPQTLTCDPSRAAKTNYARWFPGSSRLVRVGAERGWERVVGAKPVLRPCGHGVRRERGGGRSETTCSLPSWLYERRMLCLSHHFRLRADQPSFLVGASSAARITSDRRLTPSRMVSGLTLLKLRRTALPSIRAGSGASPPSC